MPTDLELRAKLTIEADTRGADQTKAALRGVRQEAAQAAQTGAIAAPAGGFQARIPQSTLDAIRTGIAGGASPKAAATLLGSIGADAATIAAVTGTGKAGAPVPAAAVPGAHPAAAAAPRGPSGASLKQTAEDSDKAGRSFHVTGNEAIRFGTSMIGLGIGLSAFSLAGRLAHDALAGFVNVGLEVERQARLTAVAFGAEAAGMTAFAQSVRQASGFTRESVLGAAGASRQLVTDGKITQQQLEQLTRVGAEYAQIAGTDIATSTGVLADAIAHGGDAASKLGVDLSDTAVAANFANGKFATTFKTLSDGEQAQIRFAYLLQQAALAAPQAAKETEGLSGAIRGLGTAVKEAVDAGPFLAFLAAITGGAAAFIDNNTKGIAANKQVATETDAAYAQAREEILAAITGSDQLQTAQGRLAVSSQIEARAQELLTQKRREATVAAAEQSDREHRGADLAVTDAQRAAAIAASIQPNRLPQFQAEGQERVNAFARGIAVAQRESLPLLESVRQANVALLGPKADLLDVEYQINRATDARLGLLDQEKVLRATMAAQGRQDALQDAQTQEQRLGLLASIRGPGRGAARAELRRFDRAQTVQRAQLAALDAERPVTAAQRLARDDAASQQLALLPLQQTAALIQRGVDARQHDLDILTQIREGDRLHSEELVLQFQKEQRSAEDALDALRKLVDFSKPGGSTLPFSDQRAAAFALPGDLSAGRAGPSVTVQVNQTITGDVSGADTALLRQVADDSGTASAAGVLAAWRQAQQGAAMPSRSTEAGAR